MSCPIQRRSERDVGTMRNLREEALHHCAKLRNLGKPLGSTCNYTANAPSIRGKSAAEIAITALDAADFLEKLAEKLRGVR